MANPLIYASIGGILPALIWLHFWLKEDRKHPEPKTRIAKTFLFGMIAVLLVLPFQKGVEMIFPDLSLAALILWAALEESFKFGAAWFGGLHSKDDNEPLDPIVYMVTAALGFVALENTLFLIEPIIGNNLPAGIIMANMRFVGASLLHVVASGFVGAAMAFSFYSSPKTRRRKVWKALLGAVIIHTVFNFLVLDRLNSGSFYAFLGVWLGAAWLIWAFEKSKSIARTAR